MAFLKIEFDFIVFVKCERINRQPNPYFGSRKAEGNEGLETVRHKYYKQY